ncbi:NAD-dependent deacylase [Sulfitobacter sp. M57]|uniref:NAD-dependent deacylase n=1 Tax=unclassified Sulfitobacter TaxID=196795 RepID=UPI0023E23C29|nr:MULTISPECIES: NAD-dependent deacylase [unclassified Sulfitobacter]MDF3415780.1 NAD-dependent deacylase [Sulfitobacter sp. KE5]MDF3423260.1 NAD-dependent deacylase [Sulfitobacter sp. KE43]MDF3434326.1 NAD-dependent deacylase [Sulfitobacter sp. KE42]MDF3459641.1 NAD-dependent deacylase [Sulfitobacter sp. S74]MDF3463864.1 NAD-dependent deacylase [Sulfitobacter sp. Ks18]
MRKIVILTGAGISAESGIETFRAEDGLWAQHRVEDVATPEGFMRDPELVVNFYNARRAQAAEVAPNAAHHALAQLETEHDGEVVVITQNVDDLHERGGTKALYHMHGHLKGALCASCDHRWPAPMVMAAGDPCPSCGAPAARPDIVWFGEMPYDMDTLADHISQADIFVAIGTSGNVYPAAGFVAEARRAGAHTIEFNLEPSAVGNQFAEHRIGPASETVTAWVAEVLAT